MIDRRSARILAMQALCQLEVLGEDLLSQLDEFLADDQVLEGGRASGETQAYARELITASWSRREEMDELLAGIAENWEVSRMNPVDRNILRIGAMELMHRQEVPAKAAINEAIEVARAFGTAESPGFVNGILDAISKKNGALPGDSGEGATTKSESASSVG